MNLCHRVFCNSHRYFKTVEDVLLPWALDVNLDPGRGSLRWRAVKAG